MTQHFLRRQFGKLVGTVEQAFDSGALHTFNAQQVIALNPGERFIVAGFCFDGAGHGSLYKRQHSPRQEQMNTPRPPAKKYIYYNMLIYYRH